MASSIDLHPPIHWGQTANNVTLRIGLTDVKRPQLDINPSNIRFEAHGCSGSRGEQLYSFSIDLYENIDAKGSHYKINDREISVTLKKVKTTSASSGWPRLTKSSAKLPWLKADFDKMTFSEDESDSDAKKTKSKNGFNDDLYRSFRPDDLSNKSTSSIDHRTNWLIFFNLFQFLAYLWVFNRLIVYFVIHRHLKDGYKTVENAIKLGQAVSVLEIIHPMIGFTKGDWLSPFLQFSARNLILFIVINYNTDIQASPIVPALLLVWSFVELFRYPFYATRLINKQNYLITWLRYTLWIVLYPLGAFLEGAIVYQSIDYYRSKGYFTLTLPNRWNFSFDFALFLSCYLFILPFGLLYMMRYMSIQRKKTLAKKKD